MQSLPMKIIGFSSEEFVHYTVRQLSNFFPVSREKADFAILAENLKDSLSRLAICTDKILGWRQNEFDPLLSAQHSSFLYMLGNMIWKTTEDDDLPTRLFLLNKALHGIDLYYKINLPPVFYLGHTVGIVLSNTTYGNYFAIFQNSTVGRFGNDRPILGTGVFMFPGCSIIGRCNVGDRTVLAQGTNLVNCDTPGNSTVYDNGGREYVFRKSAAVVHERYFRNPEF
jgi:serine O-acetyltransferase